VRHQFEAPRNLRLTCARPAAPPLRAFFEALFASTSSRLEVLPAVPERKFGDPRGIDEAATGFAEHVNDIESALVEMGNAEQPIPPPVIDHQDEYVRPARPCQSSRH
jgi:hypothetical protein